MADTPINRPGVWYPQGFPGPAFDLTQILYVGDLQDGRVEVRFRGSHIQPLILDRTEFEDAYNSLASGTDQLAASGTSLNTRTAGVLNFSRSTQAYDPYNNQLLPAGEARDRFYRLGNQIYPMHLIEGSATNAVLYSQDLSQPNWVRTNLGLIQTQYLAPDGSNTAAELRETQDNAEHSFETDPGAATNPSTHSTSIYLKGTFQSVQISLDNTAGASASVELDLTTGGLSGQAGTLVDHTFVDDAGDGWYRVSVTGTGDFSTGRRLKVRVLDGGATHVGDPSKVLYAWGGQSEESLFSTSYIQTQGLAVTRTVDLLSSDLSNLTGGQIPAGGGWSVFHLALPYMWDTGVAIAAWQTLVSATVPGGELQTARTGAGGTHSTAGRFDTSTSDRARVDTAAAPSPYPQNSLTTAAHVVQDGTTIQLFYNGASEGTDTAAGGSFEAVNEVWLGNLYDGTQPFWGWTGSIYFPRVLTPAEVADLHAAASLI